MTQLTCLGLLSDEIPDFLFRTFMSKIRNTVISFLYLAYLVYAQHKNVKAFAVLVYGHVYIIWSY